MDEQKNKETKESIYNYLKQGMNKRDSAIMAGISEATFYRWIEEDESFKSLVEASILDYKHTLVKNLTDNAVKDGRLALEVLKRRFPKEWGDNANIAGVHEGYAKERKDVVDLLQKIFDQAREKRHDEDQFI